MLLSISFPSRFRAFDKDGFDKHPHPGVINGGDLMMSSQQLTRDREFIRQLGCGRRQAGVGWPRLTSFPSAGVKRTSIGYVFSAWSTL